MPSTLYSNIIFGTIDETVFISHVEQTEKEVSYVQKASQHVAESFLRRLKSDFVECRDAPHGVIPAYSKWDDYFSPNVLASHRGLAVHAIALQIFAFSGGTLDPSGILRPLWLKLMLGGNGLRRNTPDTADCASRLLSLIQSPSVKHIASALVKRPWQAYRLGLFDLALSLLDQGYDADSAKELRLRVKLATTPLGEESLAEIEQLAGKVGNLRTGLLAAATAYGGKLKVAVPGDIVAELEEWIASLRFKGVSSADAPLCAQVINAVNLIYCMGGKFMPVEKHMKFLIADVIPKIDDPSRRSHIEGNAHFQISVLARKAGNSGNDRTALLSAMKLDPYFSTLYYRMAQLLHDQGDARAEPFYEMALALSPFDFPVANDYGIWLMESGNTEKFDSWSTLCGVLFADKMAEEEAGAV